MSSQQLFYVETEKNFLFPQIVTIIIPMNPKQQIEHELNRIDKDRKWLADASGYSYFSVRDCLAPEGKKLSARMFKAFMDAIQLFKSGGQPTQPEPTLPDRITICVPPEKMDRYIQAALPKDLKTWTIQELDKAADAWAASRPRNIDQEILDRCVTPLSPSDDPRYSSFVNEDPKLESTDIEKEA